MNIRKWFQKRGLLFVIQRGTILLERYGFTPGKAINRIKNNMAIMARFGVSPTFFTPGIVIEKNTRFIKELQGNGAEIAVHSYQHIDLNTVTLAAARKQLDRAIETFRVNEIESHGFRSPYLSCSDELLESVSGGSFGYSSNRAIWLDVLHLHKSNEQSLIFNTLRQFYNPKAFTEIVCLPWFRSHMIEIPVCVPDDLQLHDGLDLDSDGIAQAWIEMLHQTYRRGELFNLIFHPELGTICEQSFEKLLREVAQLKPKVWTARVRDISDWWREKSCFDVRVTPTLDKLKMEFHCSTRATILAKGLGNFGLGQVWDGPYTWLNTRELEVPSIPRPFVGVSSSVPDHIVFFLKEQGYILDTSEESLNCGVYIDSNVLSKLPGQLQIIDHIEKTHVPLVRYWRWPNGAKSALSITGDLDALSLADYVSRLLP